MNIILQQYNNGYYNIWEDVILTQKSIHMAGLSGLYRVHKYHKKIYDKERSCCSWVYRDLYLVKEIYGGFVEEIYKGVM